MSAAVSLDPGIANAQTDLVEAARVHIREAVKASDGFPADARLERAQTHLLAALSEVRRYQEGIGG